MGDRTNFQITFYDLPTPAAVQAAADLINELGLGTDWSHSWSGGHTDVSKIILGQSYVANEVSCGSVDENQNGPLVEAGATFEMWEDPTYEWLGSLVMHAPSLGTFQAECDADGIPRFTPEFVTGLLDKTRHNQDRALGIHHRNHIAAALDGLPTDETARTITVPTRA